MIQPQLLGGRYEVGELIGRGGMAEVHVAHDTRLGRKVAVKILRSDLARDAIFLSRFRREAHSAAGLNHASIVAVYDSGEDHSVQSGGATVDVPYIVMEFVDGHTLREYLNSRGRLAPAEAARITESVLDALAYSHRMGIVHRDIKPANVMISSDGTVKVMDFGIARAIADANATMTQTQAVIGTAQYLSPEQAQGQTVDARSDLYSTGCLLFELLTGRPPFLGDTPVAIAYQHVGEQPQPPSRFADGISPALDAVVLHALAKDRTHRYQDASAFRADLQAVRLGRPISPAARHGGGGDAAGAGAAAPGGAAAAGIGLTGAAASERTQQFDPLGPEPTEIYTPGSGSPMAGAGGAAGVAGTGGGTGAAGGAGGAGGAGSGGIPSSGPSTSTMDAVGSRPKRSTAAYVLLTLAVIAVLGALGFGIKAYLDNQGPTVAQVSVPKVVGDLQAVAEGKLKAAGFVVSIQAGPSEDIEKGKVVSQDPEPFQQAAKGSTVAIVVSTGPDALTVPELKGQTLKGATDQLTGMGLLVGRVDQVDGSDVPKGQVIATDPPAGSSIAKGSPVTIQVSTGMVKVPNVVSLDRNAASNALAEAHLLVATEFVPSDQAEGTVVGQSVKTGELVPINTTITIKVAQPKTVTATVTPSPPVTPTDSPSTTPTP